jgi:hypothetical protein
VGAERPRLDGFRERFKQEFPRVDLEEKDGGQPHYPLLVFA